MNNPYPDLEIYIKRADIKDIIPWLVEQLSSQGTHLIDTRLHKNTTTCVFETNTKQRMDCVIMEKAAKGGFVSIWFKENRTPWQTDRLLAEQAYDKFKLEVRCSTGPWDGNDEEGWIRLTEEGEQVVNWLT